MVAVGFVAVVAAVTVAVGSLLLSLLWSLLVLLLLLLSLVVVMMLPTVRFHELFVAVIYIVSLPLADSKMEKQIATRRRRTTKTTTTTTITKTIDNNYCYYGMEKADRSCLHSCLQ